MDVPSYSEILGYIEDPVDNPMHVAEVMWLFLSATSLIELLRYGKNFGRDTGFSWTEKDRVALRNFWAECKRILNVCKEYQSNQWMGSSEPSRAVSNM